MKVGIRGKSASLLRSYLQHRNQTVTVGDFPIYSIASPSWCAAGQNLRPCYYEAVHALAKRRFMF